MNQSSSSSSGSFRGGKGRGRGWWRGWRGRGKNFNHRGSHNNPGHGRGSHAPKGSTMPMIQTRLQVASPYVGWGLYLPGQPYSDHSPLVEMIQAFEKYFISWNKLFDWDDVEQKEFFTVDYTELASDITIKDRIPDLGIQLRDSPEKILACMGLAMHQIVSHKHQQELISMTTELGGVKEDVPQYSAQQIFARIKNFGSPLPLKNFKANCYGKFVTVKGTVVRVGNIKPLCTVMAFKCASCSHIQCPNNECRGRTFFPCRSDSQTQTIDWQTIRVQEIMSDSQKEAGRIPRTIDCELTRDLVDACVPGDIVTVTGIVKVNSVDEGKGRSKDKCIFLLYLDGNYVNNIKGNKRKSGEGSETSGLAMDFTMKELYAIQEIQSQPNLFHLLILSLCPSIFGHENRIPVRGDPHILVVGDPGLGKSQMLQAVSAAAPRSVYVCGNTTTASGLTVTLSKDGGSGDFALEAGALVLADQGCCCIDEFDKMTAQHQALLEAMEQQSISIAKAGIVCSLPARTSIIAAANPVGGHYNKAKTVSENLKMGGALLSRFDLVFIMLDKPDEEMDGVLSEHVMALHAGTKRDWDAEGANKLHEVLPNLGEDLHRRDEGAGRKLETAMCRLRVGHTWLTQSYLLKNEDQPFCYACDSLYTVRHILIECLDFQDTRKKYFSVTDLYRLFREYVGYARKYVHPKIGREAASVIQEFYLTLRRGHQSRDSTPITTRQLESLMRLTEARARLELREIATRTDAEDVVEIMKYSMQDVYSDQYGWLDFQRSQHGSGMSGRSQPKKFVSALQRVAEQTYNNLFTMDQMRQISKDIGMRILDFESFLSSLNNQGFLLKKGPRVYQLQTFG
ncbi:DNA helicase mcm8-like [Plakobranchus ocellatus]|uniref:DNA helicase MCM8 n=1 Tax=Plakobranchus ocellatus TaxID=259542 RepID=A0AAV4A3L6_9GAST|nr:DNA helicase mcm8-like [Plakobranchus ocellatus]